MLGVVEINSDNQIAAIVMFELDDFDAAIAELDARYLAGEAAAHANVLQPVMDTVGELNRHEPGPMLGRIAFADHRRVPFGSAENYGRAIEELWTLVPDARYWTKAVHALDAHGLVSTLVIEGTDAHGNELQWGRTFCSFPTDRGWRSTKRTTSTPPLPASRSCARRRGGWKTRQAKRSSATWRTSQPATGMRSRRYWPTTSLSTIAGGS